MGSLRARATRPPLVSRRFTKILMPGFGALIAVLVMASSASAAVSTDQSSYSPGSTVTISGDNSDNAGYLPGEAVNVNVNEPSGGTSSCDGTADGNGAWSCQVTLPSDASAIGTYDYTATGQASGVTENGQFSDSGCKGADNTPAPTDNNVAASYTTSSGTATYTLRSTQENPTGGIPGLIEYCVYPSTQPDSAAASYDSWKVALENPGNVFSGFERPNGDPSNLPFDGTTQTVGTATWNSGVPSNQLILLHINDPTECGKLYSAGTLTCFVTPGTITNAAKDLTVSKTATPSFTRTYKWSIAKSVDKTTLDPGGTATYTVTATETGFSDSAWKVTGTITVSNPNGVDFNGVNVTDSSDQAGSCAVDNGSNATIPANGSKDFTYTCTYSSDPGNSVTDTGKAAWDSSTYNTPDSSATGQANADFTSAAPKTVNKTITVSDPQANPSTLGTATATDTTPYTAQQFTYSKTFTPPASGCVTVNNTATIVETGQTAGASVKNCNSGALTMGFWQNKNGQGIITGGASTGGVCNSGTWLRNYAPFQDLSATATCSPSSKSAPASDSVAAYVSSIIKAANASGASMNAMLKAQMLATSLDVYFSDPALGSNKINALAPIGGLTIDLTHICKMIDSSTGTATCSGTYQNVSSAFGGATVTSLTVSQMLAYAASQSNVGGSTWYGQVKATQELAKNAFDAINNQVASAP
jgi:hypothetical protein